MIKKLFNFGRLKAERDTLLAALELVKENGNYQPGTGRIVISLSQAEWWVVGDAIRIGKGSEAQ